MCYCALKSFKYVLFTNYFVCYCAVNMVLLKHLHMHSSLIILCVIVCSVHTCNPAHVVLTFPQLKHILLLLTVHLCMCPPRSAVFYGIPDYSAEFCGTRKSEALQQVHGRVRVLIWCSTEQPSEHS